MTSDKEINGKIMTDAEILEMPETSIPPGELSRFLTLRSAILEREFSGEFDSTLSGFTTLQPRVRQQEDDEKKRRRAEEKKKYERIMEDIRLREDRLLHEIDEAELSTRRKLAEIDNRAIKLHDGRRAYVDGDSFRDKDGREIKGADAAEAARLKTTNSSTWQERTEYEEELSYETQLRQQVLQERQQSADGNVTADERLDAAQRKQIALTDAERELQNFEGRADAIEAQTDDRAGDLYSTSYSTDSARTVSYARTLDSDVPQKQLRAEFSTAVCDQPAQEASCAEATGRQPVAKKAAVTSPSN